MWATIAALVISGVGVVFVVILKAIERRTRTKKFGTNRERELLDKHVVITGGSSGIGLNVAIEVAKRGANISIIARSKEKLEAAKRQISGHLVSTS